MTMIAIRSSMIASASRNIFRDGGTARPSNAQIPIAKAISVAAGTAQPLNASASLQFTAAYNIVGKMKPPIAAMTGRAAFCTPASEPSIASRLISRPTRRKKIAISPSLTQCSRLFDSPIDPTRISAVAWSRALYWGARGEFAINNAASAAAPSATPPYKSALSVSPAMIEPQSAHRSGASGGRVDRTTLNIESFQRQRPSLRLPGPRQCASLRAALLGKKLDLASDQVIHRADDLDFAVLLQSSQDLAPLPYLVDRLTYVGLGHRIDEVAVLAAAFAVILCGRHGRLD